MLKNGQALNPLGTNDGCWQWTQWSMHNVVPNALISMSPQGKKSNSIPTMAKRHGHFTQDGISSKLVEQQDRP